MVVGNFEYFTVAMRLAISASSFSIALKDQSRSRLMPRKFNHFFLLLQFRTLTHLRLLGVRRIVAQAISLPINLTCLLHHLRSPYHLQSILVQDRCILLLRLFYPPDLPGQMAQDLLLSRRQSKSCTPLNLYYRSK